VGVRANIHTAVRVSPFSKTPSRANHLSRMAGRACDKLTGGPYEARAGRRRHPSERPKGSGGLW